MEVMERPRFNLNTIVSAAGFVIMLGGLLWTWAQTTARFEIQTQQWEAFQKRQDEWNESLEKDRQEGRRSYEMQIRELLAALSKQSSASDQASMEIGRLQKTDETTELRMNRLAEAFTESRDTFTEKLNALATEQALTNQTLRRIESALGSQNGTAARGAGRGG